MTELRKYKHVVAVVLLAVYAFIATPVEFWHHHNYATKTISFSHSIVKAKITAPESSNKTIEDNCQICSHHYSIANNDAVTVYFSPVTFFNTFIDCYILKKIANPGYGHSNKGPPAIA